MTTVDVEVDSAELTDIERRRVHVATLHAAQRSVREIADALQEIGISVSKSTVHNDIEAIRDHWKQVYAETYEAHCANALRRLRAIEGAVMPAALQGDPRACMVALNVHDREASLLGLNKPLKVQTSSTVEFRSRLDDEVQALVDKLKATAIDVGSTTH